MLSFNPRAKVHWVRGAETQPMTLIQKVQSQAQWPALSLQGTAILILTESFFGKLQYFPEESASCQRGLQSKAFQSLY